MGTNPSGMKLTRRNLVQQGVFEMMPNDVHGETKATNGYKAVADQITLLKNDISGLAKEVTGLTKGKIDDTVAGLQDTAATKADDLAAAIRNEPMKATAIAAGIGFIVGLLLAR
jgi:ElaB/YqjD/DUF883 family membrane-anchored ribosome-binding protein